MDNEKDQNLLCEAIKLVSSALQLLDRVVAADHFRWIEGNNRREIKSSADILVHNFLTRGLRPFNLPIISEESDGIEKRSKRKTRHWVIDPIDGTYNYLRGSGPYSISVAMCMGDIPLFGVIGDCRTNLVAWGGANYPSRYNDTPIRVSSTDDTNQALLFSGYPSRASPAESRNFLADITDRFSKVRMIGSASISLLDVARGVGDAYCEYGIMWWDVAAGLAILEGAGGDYKIMAGKIPDSLIVMADNRNLWKLNEHSG